MTNQIQFNLIKKLVKRGGEGLGRDGKGMDIYLSQDIICDYICIVKILKRQVIIDWSETNGQGRFYLKCFTELYK